MSAQLVYFEIPVSDLDKGGAFYTDLFGWGLSPFGDPSYRTIDDAEPQGALAPSEDKHVTVYFSVDDIEKAAARVGELGGQAGEIEPIPEVGRFAHCRDDQGVAFSIFEPAGS